MECLKITGAEQSKRSAHGPSNRLIFFLLREARLRTGALHANLPKRFAYAHAIETLP